MKIREMPSQNRPRERLEQCGPSALSDAELLAIILQNGTPGTSVIDLCNRLLADTPLVSIPSRGIKELTRVSGIGRVKALQLSALAEVSHRMQHQAVSRHSIRCARDVFECYRQRLSFYDREHFMALLLDTQHHIISEDLIAIGILNALVVHPREVFKRAIREGAYALIVMHNHPSGKPDPSEEDIQLTQQLRKAGDVLGIEVLDHIIIGKGSYFSFRDADMLD
mgnify:CR=1 FL=1